MGGRKLTTSHWAIRRWIEARGGQPAVAARTGGDGQYLRVDIPGFSGREFLMPITWQEFFAIFEDRQLAFVYEEEGASFQFVNRSG